MPRSPAITPSSVPPRPGRRAPATIRCGRRSSGRSAGVADALRQQGSVASVVPAEVVDQQVGRRDHGDDEPDDEGRDEQRADDEEREDRERWAHEESDEDQETHLADAERVADGDGRHGGLVLELLGG